MSAFEWALLAAACWGVAPVIEKLGLRGGIDPNVGVVVRSIGVVIGLMGFFIFMPQLGTRLKQLTPGNWIFIILGGLTASILGQICFYQALKAGDVSRVTPLVASYPLLAFLLGIFLLGEHFSWSRAAGMLFIVGGVLLLK